MRFAGWLAALLALGDVPAEESWYQPRPTSSWVLPNDPSLWRPLVVIAARFPVSQPLFGNGVLVASGEEGTHRVLTCRHVVEGDGEKATGVRVGVFGHSFCRKPEGAPDYQELEARVIKVEGGRADLALLEITLSSRLFTVWDLEERQDKSSRRRTLLSIVPYGEARAVTAFLFYPQPGQSGSPVFNGARFAGLLQGSIHRSLDVLSSRKTIEEFLGTPLPGRTPATIARPAGGREPDHDCCAPRRR